MMYIHKLDQFKAIQPAATYPSNIRTLYAPVDRVRAALLYMIGEAQTSLTAAMFDITDSEVMNALVAAMERGVSVRLVLDNTEAKNLPAEATLLQQWPASQAANLIIGHSEKNAYQHLKLAVMDGMFRISGSVNWSVSGEDAEDNEMTVIKNQVVALEAFARVQAIAAYMVAHTGSGTH